MPRYWLAIVLLTGCAAHGYRFSTDHHIYHPGQMVTATLTNYSPRAIGYNLCGIQLQRRDGNDWRWQSFWVPALRGNATTIERVPKEQIACILVLRSLKPWIRRDVTFGLNDDTPPGEYRISTSIEWEEKEFLWLFRFGPSGDSQVITTPTFVITRP